MSRAKKLTGETEIVAAVYDPEIPPSAIITFSEGGKNGDPNCVHSFREGSLQDFENTMKRAYDEQGKTRNDPKGEPLVAWLYENHLRYPHQSHTCHGCYFGEKLERHTIEDSLQACTKQHEDCA